MNLNVLSNILWFVFAILVAVAIQIPMLLKGSYNFILPNTITIVLAVFYIHLSFNFYKIKAHVSKWFRYFVFVGNIILFIYLLNRLELVLNLADSMDIYKILPDKYIGLTETANLLAYIKNEYLLFSVMLFVMMIYYNITIVRSFYNRARLVKETKL